MAGYATCIVPHMPLSFDVIFVVKIPMIDKIRYELLRTWNSLVIKSALHIQIMTKDVSEAIWIEGLQRTFSNFQNCFDIELGEPSQTLRLSQKCP
jgi:hypothetical protein